MQAQGNLAQEQVELSPEEIVHFGATNPDFYNRTWFPRAFRQSTPQFHHEMNAAFNNPAYRYLGFKCFRGSAKTTLSRSFVSRRVAYAISRTILFVSAAQDHSIRSLAWIKHAVQNQTPWARFFQLRPGSKWTDAEMQILHGVEEVPIWAVALGITGQTRGVNIDDYRPDLILLDDPCDEENTRTVEQRTKISNLTFGALEKSLAPRSEAPDAKMILDQTPLNREDLIETASRDPQFHTLTYSCFDERGNSRWPERFPTEELLESKQHHIRRNQLPLWLREMECKIVSEETSAFRMEWLNYWELLPEHMTTFLFVDPASSESKTADFQACAAVGISGTKRYLLEYTEAKGQNPEELAVELFRMVKKWKPMKVGVESIAYQRMLAWYLKQEMTRRNHYFAIEEVQDRRKKEDRIRQAITGIAANGMLYVHPSHNTFISQFGDYPDVAHEDVLEAVCGALDLADPTIEGEVIAAEKDIPRLPDWRSAP